MELSERWLAIAGFPHYEVSDHGRIRIVGGKRRGRMMKLKPRADGYVSAGLYTDGAYCGRYVHRIVAEAFLGPAPSVDHCVAHNDGNRSHNAASNLRWATYSENEADKVLHGTRLTGSASPWSRYDESIKVAIRHEYRAGATQMELVAKHGMSQSHVSRIVNNRRAA